jgi:hypothetical protein
METEETQMQDTNNDTNTQPNETNGVHFEGYIKIFDPENQEIFVEGRA